MKKTSGAVQQDPEQDMRFLIDASAEALSSDVMQGAGQAAMVLDNAAAADAQQHVLSRGSDTTD